LNQKVIGRGMLVKKLKMLLGIIFGIVFVILLLIANDYFKLRNEKLLFMKNDLTESYYDINKLKKMLQENLGENYTGDIKTDFDNFVLTKVLSSLSELENEKYKRYNSFLSTKEMEEYYELRRNKAENIEGRQINEDTYYLDINHFFDGVTFKKVFSLSHQFRNCKNLIIDLRDNSGGSFNELKDVASLFLNKDIVIYQLDYGNRRERVVSKNGQPFVFDNIVILANYNTASVSELFILALKENLNNVKVIGTRTYGKYISYSLRKFKDGSAMAFISSIMLGPNDTSIDINGIQPDIMIGNTEEFYNSILDENKRKEVMENDYRQQFDEALNYLNSKK